ncbi:hypothetical protein ACJIZ3_004862 [Penstemon smallii]|uniref:non-specific serine/threonine protein kinase n=1 Tax=Penstemon smallii TaxID=265156 RepID=A0ABD3S3E7_9LAMI
MSKVKHLLRKLHIGDHNNCRPLPVVLDTSPQTTSFQPSTSSPFPSPSPSSDLPDPTFSSENESSANNFNYFEEEFQMQLALAISVSDPDRNFVDSETAQIDAAKQISLDCALSQSLPDDLSLRYWNCNVVNYDEKVMDGFYDVCGIDSNVLVQAKMPSLVDLEALTVSDDIHYEVVLVNRPVDMELRQLEEKVYFMSMEYHALDRGLNSSSLVQKIADLIVERMGGPVNNVEDMFRRWKARNRELRICLNTIIVPLGSLDVGHSRQRALLFKVLADRINLPCKLVKGSYYTGTDEGAVNLIKLDNGSEYIIDLMGAPGTLIPVEIPSGHNQNFGLDAKTIATLSGIDISSPTSDQSSRIRSSSTSNIETFKTNRDGYKPESSSSAVEPNKKGRRMAEKIQNKQLVHDISASKRPEFARELPIIFSEKCASGMEDWLEDKRSDDLREDKVLQRNELVRRERVVDQCHSETCLSKYEQSLVSPTGLQLNNIACTSSRKGSDKCLGGVPKFELDSAGSKSSLITTGKHNVLVEDRNEVISNDDTTVDSEFVDFSGNKEAMEIASCSDQFSGVAEILWEDLQIGERIGIGSYGEVYRADWNGTEVAVKKLMKQDISGDALAQFKSEIEIMLRMRHPNVVLLMGAVICPPNMSILTEFLPRGSLYKLLHRPNIQIDEKRRIKMALDVAKGMNYLHTSNPIIVHRDLKTPNLLVDKNWVVKVCDFGMSRLQHNTFLSSKSTAGTAEWMAPEVLRNEPSNEKSDVYSFGVILWELATLRVPWTEMNSMQVVGAVGFQNRHLDIPPILDPLVAEIIRDCWNRNPQARPSFAQVITRLKRLQRLSVRRIESRISQP